MENENSAPRAPCSQKVSRGLLLRRARACMFDTPMIHSKRPLQKFLRCAETGGEELGRSEIGKHGQRERRGKRKERIGQTDRRTDPCAIFFSAKVKVKFVGLAGRPMDTRCEEH